MALTNTSQLVIRAFKDKKFSDEINAGNPYHLPINPEQMSQNLDVSYNTSQGQGTQGTNPEYAGTKAPQFKLDVLFDNTGAVSGNTADGTPVADQVKTFLDTVYFMEGGIHKPRYLKLCWGSSYTFDCVLTNLDVKYSIYDHHGAPLRANIEATFSGYVEPELRVRKEKKESPDLTHRRLVGPGDDLPLMTYQIYGNKSLYLQVAKANGLTTFRPLKTASSLVFPPITKPTADAKGKANS